MFYDENQNKISEKHLKLIKVIDAREGNIYV